MEVKEYHPQQKQQLNRMDSYLPYFLLFSPRLRLFYHLTVFQRKGDALFRNGED